MEGGEDCCAASGILPVCRMGDQVLVLLYNATGGRKSRYLIDFGGRKERLIHPSNPTSPSLSSPQEHPSSSSCLSTTLQQQQEPPLPLAPSATPSSLLSPPSQASPSGGDRKGKKEKEQTAVTASPKASETERKSRQKKTTRGGDGWEDDECCAARELWEETGSCWGLATSTVLTSFPRKDGEETRQRTESRGEEDVSQVVERAGQSKSILEIGPNEQPRSEDGLSSLLHGEKEQRQHNGDVTRPRREPADKVCKDQEVDRLPDSSLDPLRQAFLQLLRRLPVLASFEHTKYRCLVKEFPFFLPLSFLNLRGEEGPTGLSRNRRFVWVNIDALISASKMVGAPSTTSRKEEQDGQSSNSSQVPQLERIP
ncbi:hypothetical protein CSUI_004561 [Cystoisospora suis]|uniref:Uncharacterized protein n=1 Tax=Cystoisospora suis TaxID=483139 RepID=A0A2C6KWW1_9APIC|nr:hypothetical protein CSUI_004561 [Cystoisospora suis]